MIYFFYWYGHNIVWWVIFHNKYFIDFFLIGLKWYWQYFKLPISLILSLLYLNVIANQLFDRKEKLNLDSNNRRFWKETIYSMNWCWLFDLTIYDTIVLMLYFLNITNNTLYWVDIAWYVCMQRINLSRLRMGWSTSTFNKFIS